MPEPADVARLDDDPVRCLDPDTSKAMVERIDPAHKDGDTLGGVVEVVVHGLPPGLGSHVHWDRRLDARLAGALMGIQAIKGVEVGDGFALAATPGSLAHDEMVPTDDGIRRVSGRSGGTEGGMSTGEVLRVRAAMKPIATVPRALRTVDVATGEAATAHHQRSDVCAVPAAGVVAEAMVALVLADAVLEKFGGDSVGRRAQRRVLPRHPEVPVRSERRASVAASEPMGAGQVHRRGACCDAWGSTLRATPTPTSRHRRGGRISDIFVDAGEAHFRDLERKAVAEALAEHDGVLALGGGAVLDPATRELLAGHPVVFLRVGLADAVKRVGLGQRAAAAARQRARPDQGAARRATPVYEAVATLVVDTDGRTPTRSPREVVGGAGDDHDPRGRRRAVRRRGRSGVLGRCRRCWATARRVALVHAPGLTVGPAGLRGARPVGA